MNKLPTKQIYLLLVIVLGIITLSIYSTYSIFTLESQSDDIVSIHIPSNLSVSNSTYEYQQVNVAANSYVTTDLDIYNNTNDELCYGIWYKTISNNIDESKVKIYQNTDGSMITNSIISGISNRRISIIITNDNDDDVKVNIGLIYSKNDGTCSLNISSDKLQVLTAIDNPKLLSDTLVNKDNSKDEDSGYLTYKNVTDEIVLDKDNKMYISDKFKYNDELFILEEMEEKENDETISRLKEINIEDILDYDGYYTCLNNSECNILYHINKVEKDNELYRITDYDILVGYMSGVSGLRKIDNNNYYYYGDNPDNFVYYNCSNELDNKTCELWRIIGFIYDDGKYLTKLIRNDSIGKYIYENQIWENNNIDKYLNNDYKLSNVNTLKEYKFKQENIIDLNNEINDIKYLNNDNKDRVLLMNLTDYLNTSICDNNNKISEYIGKCVSNNWLNNILVNQEYTLSVRYQDQIKDEDDNEITPLINDIVYTVGSEIKEVNVNQEFNVRPVVYLSSRTFTVSGDGSLNNPYVLR